LRRKKPVSVLVSERFKTMDRVAGPTKEAW
jgi:hypothetical protein